MRTRVARAWFPTWAVVLSILLLIAGSAVAQGPPADRNPGRPTDADHPSQKHAVGSGRGHLDLENGTAMGRFVSFSYDPSAGTVTDFAVGGTTYIAQVSTPGTFELVAQGSRLSLEGEAFSIHVMDNPTGHVRFSAADGQTFTLLLPGGATANATGDTVHVQVSNASALFSPAALEGSTVTLNGSSKFLLDGASIANVAQTAALERQAVHEAIVQGRVAARIEVTGNGTDVLDYEDVNVTSQPLPNGSHRFIVDADLPTGRSFVLDFAPGLAVAGDRLGVTFFNESGGVLVPASIGLADDLEDALAADDGEPAEYWVTPSQAGAQVIVSVPSFSIHAFEVFAVPPQVVPLVVYGVVFAFLALVLLTFGAVLGRRE